MTKILKNQNLNPVKPKISKDNLKTLSIKTKIQTFTQIKIIIIQTAIIMKIIMIFKNRVNKVIIIANNKALEAINHLEIEVKKPITIIKVYKITDHLQTPIKKIHQLQNLILNPQLILNLIKIMLETYIVEEVLKIQIDQQATNNLTVNNQDQQVLIKTKYPLQALKKLHKNKI